MFTPLLTLLFASFPAQALTLETQIAKVERGLNPQEATLLFLNDGHVGFIHDSHSSIFRQIKNTGKTDTTYQIELNEQHEVLSLRVATSKSVAPLNLKTHLEDPVYTPTIVPNLEIADKIFRSFNTRYHSRSECFNRAEIWTYETFKNTQTYTMKVFMFFTRKYIREYNYGWWFHVSPFTYVTEESGTTERVLDREYMEKPTLVRNWTNYFIEPQTECPTVAKYSDYANHQQEAYCYLIKVPMYFWQPQDIDRLERTGRQKTEFPMSDVEGAYWQAF